MTAFQAVGASSILAVRIDTMNMEQSKIADTVAQESDPAYIRARNMMQIMLVKRHCALWEKNKMESWLSQVLSPQFHALVERRPELLVLYEHDPAAALAEAEKELNLKQEIEGRQ